VACSSFIFLRACPWQDPGIRSWGSNQLSHYQIGHVEPKKTTGDEKKDDGEIDLREVVHHFVPFSREGFLEQHFPTGEASSWRVHATPFKVHVNFDIPLFEGLIDADAVDKWLDVLEGYFLVHNFFDRENITFLLLKVVPHVKYWWDTYSEQRAVEESTIFFGGPYMGFLLGFH